jgi:tRNA threonylcarbamoyladenosine biosynthesis protein TsaE
MPPKPVVLGQKEVFSVADLPEAATWLLARKGDLRIILFKGGMGAGKTTFIKEICKALGVQDHVSSPTFALVNEYEDGQGRPVFHFDFYRIDDQKEALGIGVLEYFESGHLCLIEWPSKIQDLLPDAFLLVEIEERSEGARTITLKCN